jgi:hypothetical protein
MYDQYKTDEAFEQNGVHTQFGNARIRLARAGGSNKRFAKVFERETRPMRRALENGAADNDQSRAAMQRIYAEAVVLGWETNMGNGTEDWQPGIEGPDGELLPFTRENVIATFQALPDLFTDVIQEASRINNYRAQLMEDDQKNS